MHRSESPLMALTLTAELKRASGQLAAPQPSGKTASDKTFLRAGRSYLRSRSSHVHQLNLRHRIRLRRVVKPSFLDSLMRLPYEHGWSFADKTPPRWHASEIQAAC